MFTHDLTEKGKFKVVLELEYDQDVFPDDDDMWAGEFTPIREGESPPTISRNWKGEPQEVTIQFDGCPICQTAYSHRHHCMGRSHMRHTYTVPYDEYLSWRPKGMARNDAHLTALASIRRHAEAHAEYLAGELGPYVVSVKILWRGHELAAAYLGGCQLRDPEEEDVAAIVADYGMLQEAAEGWPNEDIKLPKKLLKKAEKELNRLAEIAWQDERKTRYPDETEYQRRVRMWQAEKRKAEWEAAKQQAKAA